VFVHVLAVKIVRTTVIDEQVITLTSIRMVSGKSRPSLHIQDECNGFHSYHCGEARPSFSKFVSFCFLLSLESWDDRLRQILALKRKLRWNFAVLYRYADSDNPQCRPYPDYYQKAVEEVVGTEPE
jgi:hypothetical protein